MERFAYKTVKTLDDAAALLKDGNAAVLAGGTDLLNLLKTESYRQPLELLVNIKNIPGLDEIREDTEGLNIGALARISSVVKSDLVKAKYPMLAKAAGVVASPAIREMGTIAGNLCQQVQCWYFRRSFLTGNAFNCLRKGGKQCFALQGDNRYHAILGRKGCAAVCPSDIAVALTALDATVVTTKRNIPITGFYTVMGNVLDKDEIITGIQVPVSKPDMRQAFIKFAQRPAIDFAVVSAGAAITVNDGKVFDARIVLGAVAPGPYRATAAEELLKGKTIDEQTAAGAGEAAVEGAEPLSNNRYKVQIAKTLVKRAVLACGQ
ncbi:MAG: FAD binding domain-containing protein [Dehalococcoidales bacterium]|nr:FAD binding domain-containing protein [Dehalococcoidales bacterium]